MSSGRRQDDPTFCCGGCRRITNLTVGVRRINSPSRRRRVPASRRVLAHSLIRGQAALMSKLHTGQFTLAVTVNKTGDQVRNGGLTVVTQS
jgi:hypothetical protein